MDDKYSQLVFGTIIFLLGLIFLFFNKKIIKIQGKSKDGDTPEKIRKQILIVSGVIALLGGLSLLFKYFF